MLGKLIKNEFVQRYKTVCGLYALVLVISLAECIMGFVNEKVESDLVENLYAILTITFLAALFGSVVAIVLQSIMDYNNRYFKEQGYLTHTLPVKSSTMLFARGVCDIVICLSIVVVYPLFICIGIGDFSLIEEIIELINEIFLNLPEGENLAVIITGVIGVFFTFLLGIWVYYCAYAIGHSFSTHRKGISVAVYILMYVVGEVVLAMILTKVNDNVVNHNELVVSITFAVISGLYLIACFVATSYVCKNRLNLE